MCKANLGTCINKVFGDFLPLHNLHINSTSRAPDEGEEEEEDAEEDHSFSESFQQLHRVFR